MHSFLNLLKRLTTTDMHLRYKGLLNVLGRVNYSSKRNQVISQTDSQNQRSIEEKLTMEETDVSGARDQLLKETPQEVFVQTFKKEGETYVEDYTQTATKSKLKDKGDHYVATFSNSELEWKKNSDQLIDLRGNELAAKIIQEGRLDLTDQRIQIISQSQKKDVDLGRVEVLKKNSILLSDVDINKIPDDMDIQLDKEYQELHAVGIVNEDGSVEQNIQRQIIEDVSFQKFKDKYLTGIEQGHLVFDKVEVLKKVIRRSPLYLVLGAFFSTFLQVYYLHYEISQMEDQEWQPHRLELEKKRKQALLYDERFARAKFMI